MFRLSKKNKNNRVIPAQAGMTYVEIIVVLAIFSVMSSVVMFNYGEFQDKVDIKNLASDIALKIVEAQKSSLSGNLPPLSQQSSIDSTWKPSYGVYFNSSTDIDNSNPIPNTPFNKEFIYFADLGMTDGGVPPQNTQNNSYDGQPSCSGVECLNRVDITKGNYISNIDKCASGNCTPVDSLSIVFVRPNSGVIFSNSSGVSLSGFDYIQITIQSPRSSSAKIKVYPSGRIQVD